MDLENSPDPFQAKLDLSRFPTLKRKADFSDQGLMTKMFRNNVGDEYSNENLHTARNSNTSSQFPATEASSTIPIGIGLLKTNDFLGEAPNLDSEPQDEGGLNKSEHLFTHRKRSAPLPSSHEPIKRARLTKQPSVSVTYFSSPNISKDGKSSNINIPKRPFTCVFSFDGCKSTFPTKNEWKRHVANQHLRLHVYICTEGMCAKSNSEFNRKDLFTQHLRRMHAPQIVRRESDASSGVDVLKGGRQKSTTGGSWGPVAHAMRTEKWEMEIKRLQTKALKERISPPQKLGCPVPRCGSTFEGPDAWDDKMEHIANHISQGEEKERELRHERDPLFMDWAIKEGVVKGAESSEASSYVSLGLTPDPERPEIRLVLDGVFPLDAEGRPIVDSTISNVDSTISKDNTKGEEVRQASLLAEFGRKMHCSRSGFER